MKKEQVSRVLGALVAVGSLSTSHLLGGGLPGMAIGSAGSYANSGNTIAKVLDGNLSTFHDAADAIGDWAGLDFGAGTSRVITGIRDCPRQGFGYRMVGGQCQGANVANFSSGVLALYTITSPPSQK